MTKNYKCSQARQKLTRLSGWLFNVPLKTNISRNFYPECQISLDNVRTLFFQDITSADQKKNAVKTVEKAS